MGGGEVVGVGGKRGLGNDVVAVLGVGDFGFRISARSQSGGGGGGGGGGGEEEE